MAETQLLARELFINEVAEAAKTINKTIEDDDLLQYVAEEITDRVSVYLRYDLDTQFDPRLVKIVARVVSSAFKETSHNLASDDVETSIKAISDNGQSISYGDTTRNYLATVEDGELFGGFAKLLQPYRRIRAISR